MEFELRLGNDSDSSLTLIYFGQTWLDTPLCALAGLWLTISYQDVSDSNIS